MKWSDIFYDKKFWLPRHVAFWIIMYLDEALSLIGLTEEIPIDEMLAGFSVDAALVYFNLYFLIPKFFSKAQYSKYLVFTLISLAIAIVLTYLLVIQPYEYDELFYDLFGTGVFTAGLLGIAIALKVSKIAFQRQKRLSELQNLHKKSQINYLKNQINPHFLFNTLNNIYVQSKEDPEKVSDSIMKLSELMRYQTYEVDHESISLNKEIDFIKKYLDLEKMRREQLNIETTVSGQTNNIALSPLLFLPFVENACKHSQSSDEVNEFIKIDWSIEGSKLHFSTRNNIGSRKGYLSDADYSGFGLENIKKRIALLYPQKHSINITENEKEYKVELILNLG